MPDLLGADPCETCKRATYQWGCEFRVNCLAYRLREERRELLEALKAGGELGWWRYNGCAHKWERHNDRKQNDGLACDCNLGHLIFIPEAQG